MEAEELWTLEQGKLRGQSCGQRTSRGQGPVKQGHHLGLTSEAASSLPTCFQVEPTATPLLQFVELDF